MGALRHWKAPHSAAFAGTAIVLVFAAVSAATAAGPGPSLQRQVGALQSQRRAAVLDLYALDSHIASAQQRLAALQQQADALSVQQHQLRQQLSATHATLSTSRRRLAVNLRRLYKQGNVSALAVVLGSTSLDDAVSQLDTLNAVADESEQVVSVTVSAQQRLGRLRAELAARRARIDAAVAGARRTLADLASAHAQRVAFVERLRRAERLKQTQIQALEARVQQAQQKSAALQAAADTGTTSDTALSAPADGAAPSAPTGASTPAPTAAPDPAPSGGRTITVGSTGYSLPGRTATGLPVGWGVIAVDPSVIPLGTRLTIPGYGEAVAADTGGAVRGHEIDIWFPTLAQARAWGRRTVTITLH